jgi:outer membrane protein TolC
MKSSLILSLLLLMGMGAEMTLRAQSSDLPGAFGRPPGGAFDSGAAAQQSPLFGGVPAGKASAEILPLSLADAISRGLKYNLGFLLGEQNLRSAQGARLRVLSELMPKLAAGVSETGNQLNLAAFGFTNFPGITPIVGPFNVFDARAYLSQPLLDFAAWNRSKAEAENLKAAQHALKNTRDLVVLACGDLYLQAAAGQSRIDSAKAQLVTAQALYNLALDRKRAGVAAGIDVLRAQVQLQAQQQKLIVAENDFAKQKLALARAIGLPLGQEFNLTDTVPYSPFPAPTLEAALEEAYRGRGDYQGALDLVRAAELKKKAAAGGGRPSLNLDANYGDLGQRVNSSHGTFTVAASLRVPIFEGGKVRGEVLEADATLQRQQAEAEDLRARIYYEIRSTFLDLKAAEDRVKVAQSAQNLAEEQVRESRDRFAAGVTNTIEVVQGQEALAAASENYISSLFAFNLAKVALARAMGLGEAGYLQFLRGK